MDVHYGVHQPPTLPQPGLRVNIVLREPALVLKQENYGFKGEGRPKAQSTCALHSESRSEVMPDAGQRRCVPQDKQYLEGAKEGDDEGRPHVQLSPAGVEEPLLINKQPQARHQRADHREDAKLYYPHTMRHDTQQNTRKEQNVQARKGPRSNHRFMGFGWIGQRF